MIVIYLLLACLCGYAMAQDSQSTLGAMRKRARGMFNTTNSLHTLIPFDTKSDTAKPTPRQPTKVIASEDSTQQASRLKVQETSLVPATITQERKKRVIVAMTGATGAILGIRLLEMLNELGVETHLIISKWAEATITYETDYKLKDVRALATKTYSSRDVAAAVSSGSFRVDAMIVVPCSMKTLSSIATGYGDDLISRAADVTFKERRRMILVARETPLSGIHLDNMTKVTQNGAIIFPPVPAFYIRPKTVDELIDQTVGRILDLVDIDTRGFERWSGLKPKHGVDTERLETS